MRKDTYIGCTYAYNCIVAGMLVSIAMHLLIVVVKRCSAQLTHVPIAELPLQQAFAYRSFKGLSLPLDESLYICSLMVPRSAFRTSVSINQRHSLLYKYSTLLCT